MELFGIDFGCAIEPLGNGKIPDTRACLLPLLSKLIGYWIVAASATVKLPQIMKVVNSKSASGLSILSFELDVVGYTIALSYCVNKGLPFSAYGELAFLLLQAIVLIVVIYYYSQPLGTKTLVRPLLYFVVAPFIIGGRIDPVLFEALYACQHAIFFSARIPQIWKNFKNKSTGQLSFLTSSMNLGASVARIFTSIQESAPATVTFGCLRSTLTNGILVSQIVMYRKQQTEPEKEKKTN